MHLLDQVGREVRQLLVILDASVVQGLASDREMPRSEVRDGQVVTSDRRIAVGWYAAHLDQRTELIITLREEDQHTPQRTATNHRQTRLHASLHGQTTKHRLVGNC